MSLPQLAPTTVVLSPSAPSVPNFGVSALLEELSSIQVAKFLALTAGESTLRVTPDGFLDTLDSIDVLPGSLPFIDVSDHFGGDIKPDEAFLTYQGTADQIHIQQVSIAAENVALNSAAKGAYRLDEMQGGPYVVNNQGKLQVIDLTIVDAGGGDAATGAYTVVDNFGHSYTYVSGGFNVWSIVIDASAAGLYSVTLEGITYSYTSPGAETLEQIRDGLLADMNDTLAHPGGHPEWISNSVSTDTITMSAAVGGFQLTVTSNDGPGGIEATLAEDTPLVPETIAAVAAAIQGLIDAAPATQWTSVDAANVITATASAGSIGVPLGVVITGPAAPNATTSVITPYYNTPLEVLTLLLAKLDAVTHPTFSDALNASPPYITITGVTAGQAIPAAASSPANSMVVAETQSTLTLRVSQQTRVTINAQTGSDAYVGDYDLALLGEVLMHTSVALDTITDVRDALRAQVDANLGSGAAVPLVSTADVGVDGFSITILAGGLPVTVSLTSPASNAAGTVTQTVASKGVVDDFERAKLDEDGWYFWLQRGSQTDGEAIVVHADSTQSAAPRRVFLQSSDNDIPNVPLASATDLAAFVKNVGTGRSTVLWDPVPSSAAESQQGMIHAWTGVSGTFAPGGSQWTWQLLQGVSGGQKPTAQQEQTLRAKAAAFVEFQGSFNGGAGARFTNGPYSAKGNLIDTVRALDQIKTIYQLGGAALLVNSNIVPYDEVGMGMINDMINQQTASLVGQGLVVAGSFLYLPNGRIPSIASATPQQAELGIFPDFAFKIIIQLGGVSFAQTINVSFN